MATIDTSKELKEMLKKLKIDKKEIAEHLNISVPYVYQILNDPTKHPDRIEKIKELIEEYDDNILETDTNDTLLFDGKVLKAHSVINTNPANMKLDEIREAFGLDEEKWECVGYEVKMWNTTMKNKAKEPMISKNYGVHARFKPINNWLVTEKDIEWIKEILSKQSTKIKFKQLKGQDAVMILPMFDAHFGKYAWEEETNSPYNMEIAQERYKIAVAKLVERAKQENVGKVLFPIGQDLLHIDNMQKTTTKGTPQDINGTTREVYSKTLDTLNKLIAYVADNGLEVEAFYSPGNHDTILSYTIIKAIAGYYHNDKRVTIIDNATSRYYVQIGKNLIGFTHGDKEKNRLYELMQVEARELWGKTEYAEWITGHTHDEKFERKSGIGNRTIGNMDGIDSWHYENGYTTAPRIVQAPVYKSNIAGPYNILFHNADTYELKNNEIIEKGAVKTKCKKTK